MRRLLSFILLALPALAVTNRTVTVKASGGDYTSLAAAVAGEEKNLVALDRQLTIECYAKLDTSGVVFDRTAWTTDATHYILVTVPPSERHAGTYDTSKYRIEVSNANPLQIHHGVYIVVEWLQIYLINGSNRPVYLGGATNSASNITVRNCIVLVASNFGYNGAIHGSYTGNAGTNVYIYNNLIYGGLSTSAWGFQNEIPGNYYLWNNTVVNFTGGLNRNGNGNVVAKNNLLSVTTTAATGTFAAGTNYNATNQSSMGYTVTGGGNTNDRVSQTFTFVNAGSSDYHLAESDTGARDLGMSDPGSGAFSNDIDGQARSGVWDIGMDEIPAAGGGARRRVVVVN